MRQPGEAAKTRRPLWPHDGAIARQGLRVDVRAACADRRRGVHQSPLPRVKARCRKIGIPARYPGVSLRSGRPGPTRRPLVRPPIRQRTEGTSGSRRHLELEHKRGAQWESQGPPAQ